MAKCFDETRDDFIDNVTLKFYPSLKMDSGMHGLNYVVSMHHQLTFFEAVGLGPLKSAHGDSEPPYELTEAARFCLQVRKRNAEGSVTYLAVKKQSKSDFDVYVREYDFDGKNNKL